MPSKHPIRITYITQRYENSKNIVKLTTAGRSTVFEWQTVTVAWFHNNKFDIGAPTILLRPNTTAVLPLIGIPGGIDSIQWEFRKFINILINN